MLRLFIPAALIDGGTARILGAELRHLRTMRLGPGDPLRIVDDTGAEHEAVVATLGPREATATLRSSERPARESPLDLVLAPALLKGAKMDLVVEKATEIGVRRIVPVRSRHAIGERAPLERWERIALAATKQSGRTARPVIEAPVPFVDVVRRPWPDLRLIAWERERSRSFRTLPARASAVVIVVGPEGGFADEEVEDAQSHGFVAVGLAPRILRAETAAIVAAALVQHHFGDA
jgi:16S rRNA (uracil1498-N3)-methyltransferase